jgi:phosphate transport system substrate-binding protein
MNFQDRLEQGWLSLRTILAFLLLTVLCGCDSAGRKSRVIPGDDTLTSGTIHISADESFKPIIDSQIKVFLSQYPKANIIAHYKPEAECLKDLLNDSIRMVIVTRGLSEEEVNFYTDTLEFAPQWGKIASDAIAVVVNNQAKDSIFSMGEIRSMLNGTSGYSYRLIMDGLTATSTVRFMIDSVLKGESLSGQVQAARSSEEVIDYVSGNNDAIGFVGVSWIGNKEDTMQLSFLQKVRIASLECRNCDSSVYVKPYQANIALKRYPMIRGLYYILKENYSGLGKGFTNFLTHEKGQLIFSRAYLLPDRMSLDVRNVSLEDNSF